MKIKFILFIASLLITGNTYAQKYISKDAQVSFFSKTPAENIDATNKTASVALLGTERKIAAVIIMRNFKFERPLMEEHFNENYLETSKYPKSTFSGSYTGNVNYEKDGKYPIQISGDLTLHGVKKHIEFPATITINGGKVSAEAKTQVALVDYNIEIPKLVFYKIAEKIDITLQINFSKS